MCSSRQKKGNSSCVSMYQQVHEELRRQHIYCQGKHKGLQRSQYPLTLQGIPPGYGEIPRRFRSHICIKQTVCVPTLS